MLFMDKEFSENRSYDFLKENLILMMWLGSYSNYGMRVIGRIFFPDIN